MNWITAVVPPERFRGVVEALELQGVTGIVATNAQVHGWAGGRTLAHRGSKHVQQSIPSIRIEFATYPDCTEAMTALIVQMGGMPSGVANVWVQTAISPVGAADIVSDRALVSS